jgi:hypothetical protein
MQKGPKSAIKRINKSNVQERVKGKRRQKARQEAGQLTSWRVSSIASTHWISSAIASTTHWVASAITSKATHWSAATYW